MKTITIGFSKSSLSFAPFSWLIMWGTNCPFSHAYLKLTSADTGRTLVYQASHDLVNLMAEPIFLAQETVYEEFEFQISDKDFATIKIFCYDQLGKPYSVGEVIGLAAQIICSKVGIKIKNPIHDGTSSFFCSGIMALMMQTIGVQLPEDFEDMTPKDLYPVIAALPKVLSSDAK